MAKKTAAAALIGMAASLVRVVSAAAASAAPPTAPRHDLTGAWIVTVDPPPDLPPGLPPFLSLQAYTGDGIVFVDGGPTGQAYGSWEPVQGPRHTFAATAWFIRFNEETHQLEKERIDRTIVLAQDGKTFTFDAVVHVFDMNDQEHGQPGKRTGSGKRIPVIPIPPS